MTSLTRGRGKISPYRGSGFPRIVPAPDRDPSAQSDRVCLALAGLLACCPDLAACGLPAFNEYVLGALPKSV
jgi:hypothetical protein